ncbi:Hypothetical protein ORPV_1187 [Orpheovirus IHUMI-LCC2]|uniref:Uncharacterized protein n=1 Tax=Orpheovirus IHUMI-LCC2 TaxID=2023057 RepID=A0A2I2L6F1_9VIRU|nr:Hypothetical protein ORPV_1187 [Orpheovirus IHUMI-LCC2]SNW63091.1 Hypothetical protein ORPV_1187 [Orpheovirus IHUMI-LCC2]
MEEGYIDGIPTVNVNNNYEVILYDVDIDVEKFVYINPIDISSAKIKIWKKGDIDNNEFQYSKISSLNRFFKSMVESNLHIKYRII